MKEKKTRATNKVMFRLMSDMGGAGKQFILTLFIVAASKLCLAYAPRIISRITDLVQAGTADGSFEMSSIYPACAALALLYFFGYGADGFVKKGLVYISQSIVKKLRNNSSRKLNVLPLNYLDTHPLGDIQSRLTTDMENLSSGIESTSPIVIGQLVLMTAILIMMFITDIRLSVIYLILLPSSFYCLKLLSKQTRKYFGAANKSLGDVSARISDTYSNHLMVSAYGLQDARENEFDALNEEFGRLYTKSRFISGYTRPLNDIMSRVAYSALCLTGAMLMLNGKLSIGDFLAFLMYANMIGSPLSEISLTLNNFQSSINSAERIYEFLDEEEEPLQDVKRVLRSEDIKGHVEFKDVAFRYTSDKPLMEDVSFEVRPGSVCAIVGPSGAGKTTLVNLMMRFYEINKGRILIDGVPIDEISRQNLRSLVGMVLQESWIFDGTIAENIAFGKPGATRDEIIQAAQKSGCDSFIKRLPQGYDTHISSQNCALSAGERQLLCIARIWVTQPRILILDEATSQVDTRTEERITRAMEQMMKGRTTFVIAHRLYTIRSADQILFMKDGDIKEVGDHETLMAKGGLYAKMYETGLD